jgi:hypothetical protein
MQLSVMVGENNFPYDLIAMPKAKPDQVVVHRIELQEKEREMLEAWVGGSVIKNALLPVAVVGGVGSAAYIGYKSAKAAFKWTEDIVDDIKEAVNDGVAEPILGKPTYETSNGKTLRNPFAGIPIIGGAWSWSFKQGDKTADFFGL